MYKKNLALFTLVFGSSLLISATAEAVGLQNVASFNGTNGAYPQGSLTYDSTTGFFYGTTETGGAGYGTIFSVSPSGTLSNVATFNGTNGATPNGSLTYDSTTGLFYGTTSNGGAGDGNIFSVSPSGTLSNVASFNATNGANPNGSLTYNNGLFYGTTANGGAHSEGTIFSVSPSGTLSNVATFNTTNGSSPSGDLTYNSTTGLFYGTTALGGDSNNDGTIFSVSPSGTLSNVASFNFTDGAHPYGSLTYDSTTGLFYGTTSNGGAKNNGTIFSVSPSGTLSNVASFNATNGANPNGSLTYDNGLFYGTTANGGAHSEGTIFSVSPSGTLTSLASFNNTNGSKPYGSLTLGSDSLFYGTTRNGGANDYGTIFSFDPGTTAVPEPLNILGAIAALGLGATLKRKVK